MLLPPADIEIQYNHPRSNWDPPEAIETLPVLLISCPVTNHWIKSARTNDDPKLAERLLARRHEYCTASARLLEAYHTLSVLLQCREPLLCNLIGGERAIPTSRRVGGYLD